MGVAALGKPQVVVPSPQGVVLEPIQVITTAYISHVGQVLTVARIGRAYSVYLSNGHGPGGYGYFNCVHADEPSPDLHKFKVGHKYRVMETNPTCSMLLDITLPEHLHLPNGA